MMKSSNHKPKKHENDMNEKLNNEEQIVNEQEQTPVESCEVQAESQVAEDDLAARCKQLEEEKEQLFSRLQRSVADLQNYQKKAARDRQEAIQYAELSVIERFVFTMLDDLDRALKAAEEHGLGTQDPLYKGIDMIRQNLLGQLKQAGIERIEAEGKKFDPLYHEAIMEMPTNDVEENTIVHVMNQGYTQNGKTIRATKAVVAKPIPKTETQDTTSEQ
ncbi:MAG: nucleotide exchange factor GrpE [Phycisphaerae bacterium]|nr:nucleotide exchange factor GrpE [Phycisphaerae bacterium]